MQDIYGSAIAAGEKMAGFVPVEKDLQKSSVLSERRSRENRERSAIILEIMHAAPVFRSLILPDP